MSMLVPYEPARLINDMHGLMENLWQRAFDIDANNVGAGQWLPAIDLKEEKNRFLIAADLPGVYPKDVEVSLENNVLTLKGKREVAHETKEGAYYRMERKQGQFFRQFTLPSSADNKNITATSRQGVLEVVIPKKADVAAKKIAVQVMEE